MRNNLLSTPVIALFASTLMAAPGCELERLFPDQVAEGVARLSVVNSGYITQLVNSDTVCGFASDQVEVEVSGEAGAPGIVRYSVKDCTLSYPQLTEVARSCDGVATRVLGSVTVNAIQEVAGQLTGDVNNPVIPASPDAVSIMVSATFDGWRVVGDETPGWMENHNGSVSFVAKPRLAVGSKADGVCSVPTSNVTFQDLQMGEGTATVNSGDREFDVDIVATQLQAQLGKGPENENSIVGTVSIWDTELELTDNVLDADYDAAAFIAGFTDEACLDRKEQEAKANDEDFDRIATPLSYTCRGVEEIVADGAARLMVQTAGMIASYMESGAECGFGSTDVTVVSSDIGGPGTGAWNVQDCVIDLPADTVLSTDCNGNETLGGGRAVVSATKSLTGWLSGDAVNPVIPLDDNPANIAIDVTFEGFTVGSGKGALTLPSGGLTARISPRTAYAESTGTCSAPTGHVRLSDIEFTGPAAARIEAPQGVFTVNLEEASIDATLGQWGAENEITGSISVGKDTWDLADLPSGNVLDTGYEAGAFEEGFLSCDEELAGAPLSYECNFEEYFSGGVARLSVNAFAQVVQALEADTECGFSSDAVLNDVVVDDSENGIGRPGASATYVVSECVLDFVQPTSGEPDCNGNSTTLTGRVTVSGTKTLTGISSGDPAEPIVPTTWQPATIALTVDYEDFHVASGTTPQTVTVEDGTATGTLKPQTAIDAVTGACSIPTQNVEIDVEWTKGQFVVHSNGTNVAALVDSADVSAINGRIDLLSNSIEGGIRIAGADYNVDGDLNPDFDPIAFAEAYSCAENFQMPGKPEACNFKRTLGENIARLLVQATGEVAGEANGSNSGCGFGALFTMASPDEVVGDEGEYGSMMWRMEECEFGELPEEGPQAISENCMGVEKNHVGTMTVTAERVVEGIRESVLFGIADSIAPDHPEAVNIDIEEAVFNEFQVFNVDMDTDEIVDLGVLTIHNGTLAANVSPKLSENAGDEGRFDVPTPVAEITSVAVSAMEVTLEAQNKTFKVTIDSSMMDAFNGTFGARSNELGGVITVDGTDVLLGVMSLVPDFDQGAFDAAYACNEDLMDGPLGG